MSSTIFGSEGPLGVVDMSSVSLVLTMSRKLLPSLMLVQFVVMKSL